MKKRDVTDNPLCSNEWPLCRQSYRDSCGTGNKYIFAEILSKKKQFDRYIAVLVVWTRLFNQSLENGRQIV